MVMPMAVAALAEVMTVNAETMAAPKKFGLGTTHIARGNFPLDPLPNNGIVGSTMGLLGRQNNQNKILAAAVITFTSLRASCQ